MSSEYPIWYQIDIYNFGDNNNNYSITSGPLCDFHNSTDISQKTAKLKIEK